MTLAEFVRMVPPTFGITETRAVIVARGERVPTSNRTTPLANSKLPWLTDAESKVTVAGSVSARTTLDASDGPLLKTVSV